ncbi:hypothetical protein BGZ59_001374 [Podila verticillata]|nr:hypothetical protein BGZ59_001374 [Podila verticillata]
MRVAHTRSGKPIPGVLTLLPVFFYLFLIGIGYYIYVYTLCVKLIQEGDVALGVVLVIIYHITFFMMLWAYVMVILVDPGKVTGEHPIPGLQQPQPESAQLEAGREQPTPERHSKAASTVSNSSGILIPGAQNRAGYIHLTEDPTIQSHPLWCSKCHHVKPERAHHCRVCKRCVLKMDHHCPWVLNCVGMDNYKFFFLFIFYTAVHCVYIFVTLAPLYLRTPDDRTWAHQQQVIGLVVSGMFGLTLIVFTITHIRLILLNRTTIEDHNTPHNEGMLPCLRKGWAESEGENNLGNERLYDMGPKNNWHQIMGQSWRWLLPVPVPRPEGPGYNQKVIDRQWRDYHKQMEMLKQQQEQQQQEQQQQEQQQQQREVQGPSQQSVVKSAPSTPRPDPNLHVDLALA